MQVSVIKKIRQFSKIEEEKKMKLPELKKRFTRKYVIRIIAGVLVVGMVGTGVSTANVFAAKTAPFNAAAVTVGARKNPW